MKVNNAWRLGVLPALAILALTAAHAQEALMTKLRPGKNAVAIPSDGGTHF